MATKILAISGSLRASSYNTAALTALAAIAPTNVNVTLFAGLGDLPLFNPDLEACTIRPVEVLRCALADADGLIIASPEYAHGVSGVLKNALDWLVAGEEFVHMPVALINTSPRASHAQAALREIITTMSGRIIEEACVSVPLLGSDLDAAAIVNSSRIAQPLAFSTSKSLQAPMLELRPNCECCNKDLPPESEDARICSFECTFCTTCFDTVLMGKCPNCGGEIRPPSAPARGKAGEISGLCSTCLPS